jgi:hypothetical protein
MAKPLTRALRFVLNKMGYDLLRLQKTDIHHEAKSGHGRGGGFDAFESVVPREVGSFDIILRSCARVNVLLQGDRDRFIGVEKSELILRCINSVIKSIQYAQNNDVGTKISLTILDDHSSPEFIQDLQSLLKTCPCPAKYVALQGTGVGASLKEAYEMGRNCEDIIYFAADDYLHDETAVLETIQSFARLSAVMGSEVALFPSDYPPNYRTVVPSIVMLGSHRHWRAVGGSTGADVISIGTLNKYWDLYMAFTKYGTSADITEETTINHIFKEVPCFTPLPSLSVHFQHYETLSPYFDWEKWWEASALK